MSGALWFDTGVRSGGAQPPSQVLARERALRFLDGAPRRLADSGRSGGSGGPGGRGLDRLLPDGLRFIDSWSMAGSAAGGERSGGSTVCRFVRQLRPSSTEEPVPVLGESLEVWVDAEGTVQAFGSTCRAVAGDETVARIPAPSDDSPAPAASAGSGGTGGAGGAGSGDLRLVYLGGDEDEERAAACPFWIRWQDDEASVAPASSHSMLVEIQPARMVQGMAFEAVVSGGSGRFSYAWYAWAPAAPGEFLGLGTGSAARIGEGVFDVALRVRDLVNGITERAVLRVATT